MEEKMKEILKEINEEILNYKGENLYGGFWGVYNNFLY